MEWIERLNSAVKYIEDNLCKDIDLNEAAKLACCSSYNFQRMFTYMAGVTLSEYIRRRKMSLAAVDLMDSDSKVIDVALKYGYDSPTAFNRAFKAIHAIAPSQIKDEGAVIRAFPPISFKLTISGVCEMTYRIEKKEPFRIIGISRPLEKDIESTFAVVPKMWGEAAADGTIGKLAALMNSAPMGLLGVSACGDPEDWRYFIAVSSTAENTGFEEYTVPAAEWAIFSGEGANTSIQELEKRIVTEWLPTSGYEYGQAPDIEVYLNPDPQNAKFEVWIPVVKK